MKKIMPIGLLALLAGCGPIEPSAKPISADYEWSKVEYSGHVYVIWDSYQAGGAMHDPDCPCNKGK